MDKLLLGAMCRYLPLIERLPKSIKDGLNEGLLGLKKLGVEQYGKRFIWSNGESSIITTSEKWEKAAEEEELQKSMIDYTSWEVIQMYDNNLTIITRSSDKTNSKYLKTLESLGINSGIVKYLFFKNHIEISYFVTNPQNPYSRDVLLNNLDTLNKLETKMIPALLEIKLSQLFQNKKRIVITPDIIPKIMKMNNRLNSYPTIFNDSIQKSLSERELTCLVLLRFGCTNQFIAKWIQVSETIIKQCIVNLKMKFNVSTRNDLITVANQPNVIQVSRIMKII